MIRYYNYKKCEDCNNCGECLKIEYLLVEFKEVFLKNEKPPIVTSTANT